MKRFFWIALPISLIAILFIALLDIRVEVPQGYAPSINNLPPRPQQVKESLPVELRDVQVPIPKEMRFFNSSSSQCVWCTIESLGLFNNSKGTKGLTEDYKSTTNPTEVANVLRNRNVKFLQITGSNSLDFLEKWVANMKFGCGIDVNNGKHMVTCIDFKRGKYVKIIDNADKDLNIQTWEWNDFINTFHGWAIVILPD